jgi:hypothetical protein
MDEDRIDWSEKKKQLFQLRMYQYMSTLPKRQPADPPLSNRLAGLARYHGMSIGILSQYAEKEAELILDHWRCLECEFNSDFYDEEDEFEIDRLEMSIQKTKNINVNKIFIRIFTIIFLIITIILAVKQWQ